MMHDPTRSRQWRLSFWPVLAFLVALPALVGLGIWQIERGIEKQASHDSFERGSTTAAKDVSGLSLQAFNALPRYESVQLKGRYLVEQSFLLDNMPLNGRPGYHVLTPFAPDEAGYLVIVDRGWRPGLARNIANTPVPGDETREVIGMLAGFPQPALRLEGKPQHEGWPRLVQFPTAEELSQILGTNVASSRLLLDEEAADGFVREWSPPGIPPARHYAYAFQWFALAAALVVIFILMARPRRAGETGK